jgi:membrane protease YdiL (CAAX protease family)
MSGSVFGSIPGALFEVALAGALLALSAWRSDARSIRILTVMALVALIRPISLAAAVPALHPLAWYALAGVPLLAGGVLAVRGVEEPARDLHLRIERPGTDIFMAAAGPAAGILGYVLLTPAPLLDRPSLVGYAATIAILALFGGLLEELIFRGLVLNAAAAALGNKWLALGFTAVLSMILYWGSGSIPYMLLMGAVGAGMGFGLLRGASLWGISISHGLMLATIALLAETTVR